MPADPEYVQITTFDDGHEAMAQHPNAWIVTDRMFGGGKLALKNSVDGTVIESISAWKAISNRAQFKK